MTYLEQNLPSLNDLIQKRLEPLMERQRKSTLTKITNFVKKPLIDDYKLSVFANKMIAIGSDYDGFVSVSIFKQLPESYTLKDLIQLEEELYQFIHSQIIGTPLDKKFTKILVQETIKKFPSLDKNHAQQKAIGNWGWLLPHAMMHILVESVYESVNNAVLEDKKVNRKGRIRIKKMK